MARCGGFDPATSPTRCGRLVKAAFSFLAPFLVPDLQGAGMSSAAQGISAYILKDLVRKLSPGRFPGIAPTLAALTGFILGARFRRPYITQVVVTESGIVLAATNDDKDARLVLGRHSDVLRSWMHLICSAGLTRNEFMEVQSLFAAKIGFLGPTTA